MHESASCPACGEPAPPSAKFCPECGARLERGSTAVVPPPPVDDGRSPAAVSSTEPRFFGVTPAIALLTVGLAAAAVGIVLLVAGETVVGIVLLAVAALLVGAYVGALRRAYSLAGAARARASYLGTAVAAQSSARRGVGRLRRELDELAVERRALLTGLGIAVYEDDGAARDDLRRRIGEIDEALLDKEAEIDTILRETDERVSRARFETSRTQIVAVQEPYPPPDEADPPEPAHVPEPYPPPGEADPPQPVPPETPEPTPEPSPGPPDPGQRDRP